MRGSACNEEIWKQLGAASREMLINCPCGMKRKAHGAQDL